MQKGVVRKRRPSQLSEYGKQLQAKQNLKRDYNLRERQFKKYVHEILEDTRRKEDASLLLLTKLETRLDNAVFRTGFALSRLQARQMVTHGHILVNGIKVGTPSYHVQKGDVISLAIPSQKKTLFTNAKLLLSKYQPPSWIELQKEKMESKIIEFPKTEDIQITVDIPLVFEFYSR